MNFQPEVSASTYTSFGVSIRLCASRPELLDSMRSTLPHGASSADPRAACTDFRLDAQAERGYCLTSGGETYASRDLCVLLDQLRRDLMTHVATYAVGRVFVHAGVVAWCGRVALFPGPSFAGKTTLVAELVRAGATYFSDEYAVLDAQGMVHPYPRDLEVRQPGRAEQTSLQASHLGGAIGQTSAPAAHVIFTSYVERVEWNPEPVTAGMAILEMLRHTIPVRQAPGPVMSTLSNMMKHARAFRSPRGEARVFAEQLMSFLDHE